MSLIPLNFSKKVSCWFLYSSGLQRETSSLTTRSNLGIGKYLEVSQAIVFFLTRENVSIYAK